MSNSAANLRSRSGVCPATALSSAPAARTARACIAAMLPVPAIAILSAILPPVGCESRHTHYRNLYGQWQGTKMSDEG
jgi:hypothetical protein